MGWPGLHFLGSKHQSLVPGMQRGQSCPARRQGSSCSPEGQAGKNLLQWLLCDSRALPRSQGAQQTPRAGSAQLHSPEHLPSLTLGTGSSLSLHCRQVKGSGSSEQSCQHSDPKGQTHLLASSSIQAPGEGLSSARRLAVVQQGWSLPWDTALGAKSQRTCQGSQSCS